jgi:carboxylesterase type B
MVSSMLVYLIKDWRLNGFRGISEVDYIISALTTSTYTLQAFGGDPNRVTIWGGSAGGGSVSLQLTAGGAYDTPPFQAAIAEYPWWQSMLNASQQEVQYQATLQAANCTTLRCLRNVPESKLWIVNQAMQNISYLEGAPGTGVGAFWLATLSEESLVA